MNKLRNALTLPMTTISPANMSTTWTTSVQMTALMPPSEVYSVQIVPINRIEAVTLRPVTGWDKG